MPPLFDGLQAARQQITPLEDLLRELRTRLPPSAGTDYPEQALLEALDALRGELRGLTPEQLPPGESLGSALGNVRRLSRELLRQLGPAEAKTEAPDTPPDPYTTKLALRVE